MNGRALLAWNLRRLRGERGVSQERLAADSGIDRAHVSDLEREESNASVDLLGRLAAALDVGIAEFFAVPSEGAARPGVLPKGRKRRKV